MSVHAPPASTGATGAPPLGVDVPPADPMRCRYTRCPSASSSNLSRLKNRPQPSRLDLVSCYDFVYPVVSLSTSHGCQNPRTGQPLAVRGRRVETRELVDEGGRASSICGTEQGEYRDPREREERGMDGEDGEVRGGARRTGMEPERT